MVPVPMSTVQMSVTTVILVFIEKFETAFRIVTVIPRPPVVAVWATGVIIIVVGRETSTTAPKGSNSIMMIFMNAAAIVAIAMMEK